MRVAKTAVSAAVLGSLLLGGASAFAATTPSTPAGGQVKVFATPNSNGGGTIVITGAIGDYGHTLTINKNGTPDPNNGNYVRITLQKGTFEVDSTTLNAKANKAQPTLNKATCSAALSVTGPVTLFSGTGLYVGITGTVSITETYAFILPQYTSGINKGQCNTSSNSLQPISQYASITGTGTVSFS
jgi:hypothetical protein